MSYTIGSPITAQDFRVLCEAAYEVYGPGEGDLGYGQLEHPLPRPTETGLITAEQWEAFYAMFERALYHQSGSIASIDHAHAHRGDPARFVGTVAATLDRIKTNRFESWAGGMETTTLPVSARSTNWTGAIRTTIDVQFPSEDAVRYFFNGGGEIHVSLSHDDATGGSANAALANSVKTLKTVLSIHSFLPTEGFAPTPVGYYELASPTEMGGGMRIGAFDGGTGPGGDGVSYSVQMSPRFVVGERGGNGSTLRVSVALLGAGIYNAGTTVNIGYRRSRSFLRDIASPSLRVVDPF